MMENKFPDGQPSQAVWNDYVDFKIKVNDNGDDRVTLTGKITDFQIPKTKTICSLSKLKEAA